MKRINELEKLNVMLTSEMLSSNLKMQELAEDLQKRIEEREHQIFDREEEIFNVGGTQSDEMLEEILEKLILIENEIHNYLGIDARALDLDELIEVNNQLEEYKKRKMHSDLADMVYEEVRQEDKAIFVFSTTDREYHQLKFDAKHYYLLSKLMIIEENGVLLYMLNSRLHYDNLLHFIYRDKQTTIITTKNEDVFDIREENLEFIELDLNSIRVEIEEGKEALKNVSVEELEKNLNQLIDAKAQETIKLMTDAEEILDESSDIEND